MSFWVVRVKTDGFPILGKFTQKPLPLAEAVILYRAAPRIERHFHLFNVRSQRRPD